MSHASGQADHRVQIIDQRGTTVPRIIRGIVAGRTFIIVCAVVAPLLSTVKSDSCSCRAGTFDQYHIGLVHVDTSGELFGCGYDRYDPFDPSTNFFSDGGLVGVTEQTFRRTLATAVEDAFRSLDTGQEQTTVRIAIHDGPVSPATPGRRMNVAIGAKGPNGPPFFVCIPEYGHGKQNVYDSMTDQDEFVAITYLNYIDTLSDFPDVDFKTLDQVVNSITGTTAHEIGHAFDAEHIDAAPDGSVQPIMALSGTGLLPRQRLEVREFSTTDPVFEPNADVIIGNAGTVVIGDFNFDSSIDGADAGILFANWGQSHALFQEGDANNDHFIDAADASVLITNWTADNVTIVPETTSTMIMLIVIAAMARRPLTRVP